MEHREKDLMRTARQFSELLGVDASVRADGVQRQAGAGIPFCSRCTCPKCSPGDLCEYGLSEAFRWQGRYTCFCPAGLTFEAACTAENGRLSGGIVLGPYLLGESPDAAESGQRWLPPDAALLLPQLSARQSEALGRLLLDAVQVEVIDSNVPNVYTPYAPGIHRAQQTDIAHKIRTYLHEHFSEKVSLQDIALHVYLSRTYVSTLFREETGCSITEYLNSVRVDHACRMLRETDLSLSEIAQACGFEDQSYFNRVFKKALCRSPIQYRRAPVPEKKMRRTD